MTRVLGLDIGDNRVGVAICDQGGVIARPLRIIERKNDKQVIDEISKIIQQYEVSKVIAGLPLTSNGTIGHQAEKVKVLVEELRCHINTLVEYRDESLTTLEARRLIQETRKKKKRRIEKDDAIAAAYLLQRYLDECHDKQFPFETSDNAYNEDG